MALGDVAALVDAAGKETALGGDALGDAALEDTALGDITLGDTALRDIALGGTAPGDTALGDDGTVESISIGSAQLGSFSVKRHMLSSRLFPTLAVE